ncbi:UPF0235 protein Swol_0959-like isoform X2 [Lycorma delicatula]|uniref:UPF0235 protein Swol_0959-like isoform X2 n=1 Tax=Lycorma delicatula TaxID=130591 RepID=UPI003F514C78
MVHITHSFLFCWIFAVIHEIYSGSSESEQAEVVTCDKDNNIYIKVKVKPRSVANTIIGIELSEVTVCVNAPDTGRKANEELIKYFAEVLKVKHEHLSIVKGAESNLKIMKLIYHGLSLYKVITMLDKECGFISNGEAFLDGSWSHNITKR